MSASNSTPFLKLPQFVATDKPTWLGDFNSAMSLIDTGVGNNNNKIASQTGEIAAAVEAANQAASQAAAAVTTANSANNAASSAATTANSALSKATNIQAYMVDLTQVGNAVNPSGTSIIQGTSGTTTGTIAYVGVSWALNADGTYGKIYGQVFLNNAITYSGAKIRIPAGVVPFKRPSSSFEIAYYGFSSAANGDNIIRLTQASLKFNADGSLDFYICPTPGSTPVTQVQTVIFPCFVVLRDFGDKPVLASFERMMFGM